MTFGTLLASIKKLRKIDEVARSIHYHIREEDHCYYIVERTSKVGYSFSKANQLIVNLKKRPNSSPAELNYKARAISSCAKKLGEILKDKIKETATFVPVPPSKAVDHLEYDDRIEQVCRGIAPGLDVRNLVVQGTSMRANHERGEDDRITLQELLDHYSIDEKLGSVYKSYAFMACSFSNQRGRTTMDHKQFQDWLSGIDHLSPAQRQEAETVFMGVSEASSSLAAIEASVGESRQCPHCGTPGAISRGKARGLRRYQCKGCNKTFNAATGTPLSGLHRKDKWLAFGTCLSDGLTVRASAERCKFAVNTAFRWRHRFLTTDNPKARKLTGIVEVDETYVLQSQKGERNLERKARRRGGKARKRGLSDEQVPVLVAADRSGMTVSAVLPAVNADTLQSAIEPVVDDDIVLVTDGHRAYPPCAAALGVRHEALNLSGGERVREAFHIQTLNNRHSQLKDFLRRYRGVATKYLDNYLRWFQRLQLENASPRACLATAIADPCIRFVN